MSIEQQIDQLNQARNLALSSKDFFPQVIRQILPICNNNELKIQRWCSNFLREAFQADESSLASNLKMDLSLDSLDSIITLAKVADPIVFKNCICISLVVFRLVFRFIVDNPQNTIAWIKICEVRELLLSKYNTTFPYPSENEELDSLKGADTKLALLPFIILVIEHQSSAAPSSKDPRVRSQSPAATGFSLSVVSPDHPLIKRSLESDALSMLEQLINKIDTDIMVPSIFSATMNQFIQLIKKRPQFTTRILKFIENYDTNLKLQSNYESVESYKLSKKFIDRSIKIFLNFLFRFNLVPSGAHAILSKKLDTLIMRGDEIRKKDIFAQSPDDRNIKKRKLIGFFNNSAKLPSADYKDLYLMTDPTNDINSFDISTLPQNILITMTLTALSRADLSQLAKGLNIISQRYMYGLSNPLPDPNVKLPSIPQHDPSLPLPPPSLDVKPPPPPPNQFKRDGENGIDGQEEEEDYNPETIYTLPPPKMISQQEKKNHVKLIIENFFKLANSNNDNTFNNLPILNESGEGAVANDDVNSDLNRIAITNWKKDSWLVLLTRLATRGMRTIDGDPILEQAQLKNLIKDEMTTDSNTDEKTENSNETKSESSNTDEEMTEVKTEVKQEKSEIAKNDEELSDMIRSSIFEYFLNNIQSRIDLIIEWLNEEWYSEKIFNEDKLYNELKEEFSKKSGSDEDIKGSIKTKLSSLIIPTPTYIKWTGKVLDSMIPFLEPNDRKIFIRLLSDLPYLNGELVMRLKSLCVDPVRSKIGFQSLQFLIMYRPPVKKICILILEELSDNEDLKDDCESLLKKYYPEKYN